VELLDVPYVGSGVMASAVWHGQVVFKELIGGRPGFRQVG